MKLTGICVVILFCLCPGTGLHAEDPADLTRRGVDLSEKKQYREAAEQFEKAIDHYNRSSARTYHNMGWVQELKGDHAAALKYYEEAIRRNPGQLPTFERAGYLYFKTGEYEKAVEAGEYVIKKDPNNQEVMRWLPEAYKLKLQKQQEMMLARQLEEEKKKQEELRKDKQKPEEKEEKEKRLFYGTFDFMLRSGYFFDGNKYKYITTDGLYSSFPENLYLNFTPLPLWEFDLSAGRPYLGAMTPDVIVHTETLQAMFHLDRWFLGAGIMGNHYRNDFNFGKKYTLHDFKAGVLFGVKNDKYSTRISFYPRFLPHDGPQSSGKTLDVSYMEFSYHYTVDKVLSYYSKIIARDYYFYNHPDRVSNYYGVYDITFGVSLGRLSEVRREKYLTFTLEFTERFYLRDLLNDDPYSLGNGQGLFGADTDGWFKGSPFSGFYTQGHQLSIRAEERLNRYLFIYQTFIFEMAGTRGDHNEFSLLLGVGGSY